MRVSQTVLHQKLNEQLTHAMHRLASLETSLSSISKLNKSDIRSIEARQAAIGHLRNQLHRNLFLLGSKTIEVSTIPAGQLVPDLSGCTPLEIQIYRDFAAEQHKMIAALASQIRTLANWSRLEGRSWWAQLRATLKLSKISALIANIKNWQLNLDAEHNQVDVMIKRTVTEIAGQQTAEQTDGSIAGLIKIFSELDATTDEVSQLQQQIQHEESLILRMRAWLQQEEKFLRPNLQPAPAQADIESAAEKLEQYIPDPIGRSRERLTVARRFTEEFTPQTSGIESALGRQAASKRLRPQGAVASRARTG